MRNKFYLINLKNSDEFDKQILLGSWWRKKTKISLWVYKMKYCRIPPGIQNYHNYTLKSFLKFFAVSLPPIITAVEAICSSRVNQKLLLRVGKQIKLVRLGLNGYCYSCGQKTLSIKKYNYDFYLSAILTVSVIVLLFIVTFIL